MLIALVGNDRKIAAPEARRGKCPDCGGDVYAKCGEIVAHHWAHLVASATGCYGSEPETEWHQTWKRAVAGDDPERMEVSFVEGEIRHRADCLAADGVVVEIQNSPMARDEIVERGEFYGRHGGLLWVLNYTETEGSPYDVRRTAPTCPVLLDRGAGGVECLLPGRSKGPRYPSTAEAQAALREVGAKAVIARMMRYFEAVDRREAERLALEAERLRVANAERDRAIERIRAANERARVERLEADRLALVEWERAQAEIAEKKRIEAEARAADKAATEAAIEQRRIEARIRWEAEAPVREAEHQEALRVWLAIAEKKQAEAERRERRAWAATYRPGVWTWPEIEADCRCDACAMRRAA